MLSFIPSSNCNISLFRSSDSTLGDVAMSFSSSEYARRLSDTETVRSTQYSATSSFVIAFRLDDCVYIAYPGFFPFSGVVMLSTPHTSPTRPLVTHSSNT